MTPRNLEEQRVTDISGRPRGAAGHGERPLNPLTAGALIHGHVTAVHQSEGSDDPNVLKLHLTRIDIRGESYPFDADLTDANPQTETGESLTKIGGGAAAGAILGGILGDDAMDAAIGAAAGQAVAPGTRDDAAVLERGSKVELQLTEPLSLN